MNQFCFIVSTILWTRSAGNNGAVTENSRIKSSSRATDPSLSKITNQPGVRGAKISSKVQGNEAASQEMNMNEESQSFVQKDSIASLLERMDDSRRLGVNQDSHCRNVLIPLEFYMDSPYQSVYVSSAGNNTGGKSFAGMNSFSEFELSEPDPQELGNRWIFNGPLYTFDFETGLKTLKGFYVSGICTRTYFNRAEIGIPGVNFCSFTFTLDTGASIIAEGEIFDGWDNNLSIEGGTYEMMGSSGQCTVTPHDEMLRPLEYENDAMEDSSYYRARATLVTKECDEGFYNDAFESYMNIMESGIDPLYNAGGVSYPDPFEFSGSERFMDNGRMDDDRLREDVYEYDDYYMVDDRYTGNNNMYDDDIYRNS